MIVVIDYGMGNLRSVYNAFRHIGIEAELATTPRPLADAGAIVLPGVGAFGETMKNLERMGFVEALQREVIEKGKPFLGICIGMEVMLTRSFEHGEHAGLAWIAGDVRRFDNSPPQQNLRVPHVGWNSVDFDRADPLVQDLGGRQDFYFVHSYYCQPRDAAMVVGSCDYGTRFAAIVANGNLRGVQFHPEKSHRAGLTLLKNWAAHAGQC
jgi:glutamine amidotransferase